MDSRTTGTAGGDVVVVPFRSQSNTTAAAAGAAGVGTGGAGTGGVGGVPVAKKALALGDAPVSLCPCFVKGKPALLAAGERAAVLFWAKEGVRHSMVALKVCFFLFLLLEMMRFAEMLSCLVGRCGGQYREDAGWR